MTMMKIMLVWQQQLCWWWWLVGTRRGETEKGDRRCGYRCVSRCLGVELIRVMGMALLFISLAIWHQEHPVQHDAYKQSWQMVSYKHNTTFHWVIHQSQEEELRQIMPPETNYMTRWIPIYSFLQEGFYLLWCHSDDAWRLSWRDWSVGWCKKRPTRGDTGPAHSHVW